MVTKGFPLNENGLLRFFTYNLSVFVFVIDVRNITYHLSICPRVLSFV